MRIALLVAVITLTLAGSSPAQIPDLPTLGSSWLDVGYPKIFYTPRNGFTFGLYYAQFRPPGFDDWAEPPPYRASIALDWQLSTSGSRQITLNTHFPNFFPGWRLGLKLAAERHARENYYGLGNGTEFDGDLITDAQPHYYESDHRRIVARGEIQRRIVRGIRMLAGFHAESWRLDTMPGPSLLASQAAEDGGLAVGISTGEVAARLGLIVDTRDDEVAPLRGVLLQAIVDIADSTVAGDLSYTRTMVSAAGYVSLGPRLVVAARALGQSMGGSPGLGSLYLIEGGDRSFEGLGGASSHRGLMRHRFLGEDKLFGNLEARYLAFGQRQVVAVSLVAFLDVGRVFQPDEEEFRITLDGMHVGGGLGPMISIGRGGTIGLTTALGPDGVAVSAHSTWTL